jgi:hypothetical protein
LVLFRFFWWWPILAGRNGSVELKRKIVNWKDSVNPIA